MSSAYLESPYLDDPAATWLRGNLHTHTTVSDGQDPPQEMVRTYARLGHDFLCLSDHDTMSELAGLDPCGLLLIDGVEQSAGLHVLDAGARKLVAPGGDQQGLIDAINTESGLPILCHPNWTSDFNHYPYELMLELTGYLGIEVFNGLCLEQPGNHVASDKWDRLLTAGRKIWGFANDDAHSAAQTGRGWNVVRARERSVPAILQALRAGSFYASSGVQIASIRCQGPRLLMESPNADRIAVFGEHGGRVHLSDGPTLDFDASDVPGRYIRAECYGRGGDMAWTQPFYIRNGLFERRAERLARLGAADKASLSALRADRLPRMTGLSDDPLWQQAPIFERFMRIQDGEPTPVWTRLRAILAEGRLVLSVLCQEPRLEELKLTVSRDMQGNIWTNDSIEFFLDTEGRGRGCWQLVASAQGRYSVFPRGTVEGEIKDVRAVAGAWDRGGDDRGWGIEVAVAVGHLAEATRPGARWGLHVCRNRYPVRGTFVWSWVGASNHNLPEYGALIL